MQTIEEILEFIKRKDTNVKKLAKESGVSSDRIYSWRKQRGVPKSEDTQKLLEWSKKRGTNSKDIEKIPNEDNEDNKTETVATTDEMAAMYIAIQQRLDAIESNLLKSLEVGKDSNSLVRTVLLELARDRAKENPASDPVKIFEGSLNAAKMILKETYDNNERIPSSAKTSV